MTFCVFCCEFESESDSESAIMRSSSSLVNPEVFAARMGDDDDDDIMGSLPYDLCSTDSCTKFFTHPFCTESMGEKSKFS